MKGKIIIFSAPSGSGKSTLINHLLQCDLGLEFSISATSRAPRGKEKHGKEYYFLTEKEFVQRIHNDDFAEYEEVYQGCFYGTLNSEVERIRNAGKHVIMDIDVVGGVNLKKKFGDEALAVIIIPPSVEVLKERLLARATDSHEVIEKRLAKAALELSYANQFDQKVVNDDLATAQRKVEKLIRTFIQ